MAEGYQTEEEQVEALKKWWQENGKSTVISIVVAVAAVFGWQGWQEQRQSKIYSASATYQNMITAATASNGQPTAEQLATANHLAETLKKDFADTTYAYFAALYKAKFAVDRGELAEAEEELNWVLASDAEPEIALQAQLRLARVLSAQGKYEEALELLSTVDSSSAVEIEEIKGDVYFAKGDKSQALLAYQKASELSQQSDNAVATALLKLKLNHTKSASTSTVMTTTATDEPVEASPKSVVSDDANNSNSEEEGS